MTLRARITALTALVAFLASIVVAVASYLTVQRVQLDMLDQGLLAASADVRTRAVARDPRQVPPDVYLPYAISIVKPGSDRLELLRPAGFGDEPLPFPALSIPQARAALTGPVSIAGEPSYRIVSRESGPQRALVTVATPLTDVQAALQRLAVGLSLAVVGVTLAGSLIAWFAVRRLFRPVDEMVDVAGRIAGGDTALRVPAARTGTELGDLADSLNRMIESLTASIATVGASEARLRTFVSDASHEIRTPLTVIRGYAELLLRESAATNELETKALTRIDSESRRLEGLVTQLLLLERMDALHPEAFEIVDLAPIVREAFEDLTHLGEPRPVTIETAPAMIRGNADAWRQVVANLAQNITRYTPAASPVRVEVGTSAGRVVLTVDDAGPGIPPSQREAVLARFTRLDPSRSSTTGGFGLGMSIVRSVVTAHEGEIALDDSPLGGLRVRIELPAAT